MVLAAERFRCPACGHEGDIADLGFFAEWTCPVCASVQRVHTLLANFRLLEVLGYGGMSTVYRAEDLVLGRAVAIKILHGDDQNAPERRRSFEQECANLARVRHENVVSLYSAGWSRGYFYIVMEVVEGTNLELMLAERHALSPREALDVARQVVRGLRAAAARGVLHRDIKPGNMILTPEGTVKLLDFGLAQESQAAENASGMIWATPFYASPETLRREREDERSDLYALGMTLRHALTGENTLPLPEGRAVTPELLLELKRQLPPLAECYPAAGAALRRLVDGLTAFDPAERPADADEALRLVEQALRDPGRVLPWLGMGAAVAAAVLGFSAAFLGAEKHVALAVEDAPLWEEAASYRQLTEEMRQGQVGQALPGAMELARTSRYAPLRAAAAQLARAAVLLGEGSAELLQELPALPEEAGEESPLLAVARALCRAQAAAERGDYPAALEAMEAARAALTEREAAMMPPLKTYRSRLSQVAAEALRGRAQRAMRQDRPAEACQILARWKALPGRTPREREEIEVQTEICEVAEALLAALEKQGVPLDTHPLDVEAVAQQLQPEPLAAEARCLLLLLHGERDRAFAADPYAAAPDAREPFAVMLRDWKRRCAQP